MAAALLGAALAGCSAEDLRVVDSTITAQPAEVQYLGGPREVKRVFTPQDEKVTLSVRFARNFIGAYQWFKVEWIRPDGKVYLREGSRTEWGSHQNFYASMPIRGTPAAKFFPGLWKVRLYVKDRLLVQQWFELRIPKRITAWGVEHPLAHANRPIPPGCPPLPDPPGTCVDQAPQE